MNHSLYDSKDPKYDGEGYINQDVYYFFSCCDKTPGPKQLIED